jgi:hypothetical protein
MPPRYAVVRRRLLLQDRIDSSELWDTSTDMALLPPPRPESVTVSRPL